MARTSPLFDGWEIIHEAERTLPQELKIGFLEALAELEDQECHRTRKFPKTRLHRIVGYKEAVYRADVDKTSGWRLHLQYEGGEIHLKDIVRGQKHDGVLGQLEAKKVRYQPKRRDSE